MNIHRRQFTALLLYGLASTLFMANSALADTYPNKPIRLVVPFSPGAANDTIARLIGQKIGEAMGQPVVIENRAGAGGAVGANFVAKARPDGYTLLFTNPGPGVITPLVTGEKTYAVADLVPIVSICSAPLIIVANPDFPPNNTAELVAYAKANPGKVRFGSADAGGIPGLALKLFLANTDVDVLSVPFKGSAETVAATVSGVIDVVYASYASSRPLLTANRLKVLGVAGPKRIAAAPNAPTLSESGVKDADAIVWFGLAAPHGTPKAVIDRINTEVNKALQLPDVKQKLTQLELEPVGGSPEEFGAVVSKETTRVRALVKAGKLTAE
jgi:tripartite-type tricarboxylate transporter receptor subunit TctC